eukprot:scaffold254435_cov18-Tisochrysis_lutea.AAC.2
MQHVQWPIPHTCVQRLVHNADHKMQHLLARDEPFGHRLAFMLKCTSSIPAGPKEPVPGQAKCAEVTLSRSNMTSKQVPESQTSRTVKQVPESQSNRDPITFKRACQA